MRFLGVVLVVVGILGLSDSINSNNNDGAPEDKVKFSVIASTEEKNSTDELLNEMKDFASDEIENEEQKQKRFGYVLGNGFSFGKRFGNVLGRGMGFGKRYGHVLGKGMGFGKRFGSILGHGMSFGKRYGSLLGKGFALGKRAPELYEQDDTAAYKDDFQDIFNEQAPSKRDNDEDFDEDMEFVDLSGPVDEKKWVLNNIYGSDFNYKRSKRDTRTKRYIHNYGNVLGKGFPFRQGDETIEPNSIPGGLGLQASISRVPVIENDVPPSEIDKRLFSGYNGRGYISGKRQYNTRRGFGSVLGRGFSFGKRDIESDNDEHVYTNDEYLQNTADDSSDFTHNKRYFHSSPGHRFLFGKRDMENRDKRFGYVLGRGFSFGKRRDPSPRKRYGLVLGRGFSFGKRSSDFPRLDRFDSTADLENDQQLIKRAGLLLGRGYMFGKRNNKRFGLILGNGFSFGKRGDTDQQNIEPEVSQFIDNHGNIFIRTDLIEGFDKVFSEFIDRREQKVFSCAGQLITHHVDLENEMQSSYDDDTSPKVIKKRSSDQEVKFFIDEVGHIFVNADDISSDERAILGDDEDIVYYTCDGQMIELFGDTDKYDDLSKRGWGSVLGRGFRFGKRLGSKKRFGHILGNGFSFGK